MAKACSRLSEATGRRNEEAWQSLFSNPSNWWDYRPSKSNPNYPDFRHKISGEPLWLDSSFRPSWVDSWIPSLSTSCTLLSKQFYSLLHGGYLEQALHLLPGHIDHPYTEGMYLCLLKSVTQRRSLCFAKLILSHISSCRLPVTGLLGDHLVITLAKCGALDDALHLLFTLMCRTVFSWTAIISAYVDFGKNNEALQLYSSMLQDHVEPNTCTFVSLLKACSNIRHLDQGRKLHAEAYGRGLASNTIVSSTLVLLYGKCGAINEAELVFEEMELHDDVAWSGMLSAYIDDGQGDKALQIYRQMQEEGIRLYNHPFVAAVQACGILVGMAKDSVKHVTSEIIEIGRALHLDALREGVGSDPFVGSSLVNFYGKVKAIKEAERVCDGLSERDVVAWTAMLEAYVEDSQGEKALQVYARMQQEGVSPNELTFLFAFQACGIIADKEEAVMVDGSCIKLISLEIGHALRLDAERQSIRLDAVVGSTLVSMYGKCGAVQDAEAAFGGLPDRDIITWTAMLSAYVQEGLGQRALKFYAQMQKENLTFTDITLVSVLQACRGSGSLGVVRELHFSMVASLCNASHLLANTLVHAYGTCASMVEAQMVFDGLPQPDVVSWSACIGGYSQEGNCVKCLKMCYRMQLAGVQPDHVTFLSLLSALRHAGLVVEAIESFESMHIHFGVMPGLKHYAAMIDLLSRAGNLNGVGRILRGMRKQPDGHIFLGLLGACRTHGHLELGKEAFGYAIDVQPTDASAYVLMSNLYVDDGIAGGGL